MKFVQEISSGNQIIRYGSSEVAVATVEGAAREVIFCRSLVITPERLLPDWPPQQFGDLLVEHFELLLPLSPEVVVLGAGARLRFPAPALYAPLISQGIGVEVMDTPAACRTYNILAGEGRRVAAALLLEPA